MASRRQEVILSSALQLALISQQGLTDRASEILRASCSTQSVIVENCMYLYT